MIVNPILYEAGVAPSSVKYLNAGTEWAQVTAEGRADAALTWEGLRAQWIGQGLKLKFLLGSQFSRGPSNSYAVRKADLNDPAKVDLYTRFLAGVVMGMEFTKTNPRAAADITYGLFPDLQNTLSPQLALNSMLELAVGYSSSKVNAPYMYGWHYQSDWQQYLNVLYALKQVSRQLQASNLVTNRLVQAANGKADVARAVKDARSYKLSAAFAATRVPAGTVL